MDQDLKNLERVRGRVRDPNYNQTLEEPNSEKTRCWAEAQRYINHENLCRCIAQRLFVLVRGSSAGRSFER